ncbi:Solitary outer membrane autotransporter beta-barrel domain [Thalassotalea agarivorans]|uniref:Solitary outer membrane autotransporter beta-barrel domain-containing protein n=1 Tax=Thalassotalea agarivorans TaxID=349064 RepID=A0A1I0ERI4_THASX|nr:Solitary outer membrane autotransporter beta-barrel domain [Thalassotalea agarivorans]SET47173.1 Solitary outer membrane autotransporter beta-barrel domain-containing protein [Thalassotalea agarivorans]
MKLKQWQQKARLTTYFLCSTVCLPSVASTIAQKQFEEVFATAVVISNSETITLGFANFDPDEFIPELDTGTTPDSLSVRNNLSVFSIPYTVELPNINDDWQSYLSLSASYVKDKGQQITFTEQQNPDSFTDKIGSIYVGYGAKTPITEQWTLTLRLGGYLMHHHNEYDYQDPVSISQRSSLDDVYFNTSANAFVIEPNVKMSYLEETRWGHWQYDADLYVFYGKTFAGDDATQGASPSGLRLNNRLTSHISLHDGKFDAESLYLKFQRVDVQGDMESSLKTNHFYEVGFGFLFDTTRYTSWVDNIGIGINIHKGSVLSGGSVVLYINE